MSFHTRSAAVASMLLLLSAATAGAQVGPFYDGPRAHITWPPGLAEDTPFRGAVSGRFSGNDVPDVVVVGGTTPYLVVAPAVHQAIVSLGFVANDVAVLAGAGPAGGDALLCAGPSGLRRWTLAVPAGTLLETSEWAGARRVRAAGPDGGKWRIAGIDSSGEHLLIGDVNASGFTPGASVGTEGGLQAIEFLDWNGDGDAEIAYVTESGLTIAEHDGSFVAQFEGEPNGDSLAVLHRPGGGAERLAWVTATPGTPGHQSLRVMAESGEEAALPLGALTIVAIASGDVNGDGRSEIAISHRLWHSLYVLVNWVEDDLPSTATFTTETGGLFEILTGASEAAPSNEASPVFADLDGDEMADVLFANHDTGSSADPDVFVVKAPADPGTPPVPAIIDAGVLHHDVGDDLDLVLEIGGLSTGFVPGTVSELELVVWTESSVDGVLAPAALSRHVQPLEAAGFYTFRIPEPGTRFFYLSLGWKGEMRFPRFIAAFFTVPFGRMPQDESTYLIVELLGGGGGQQGGGIVPIPIIPPPPPGGVPQPPP